MKTLTVTARIKGPLISGGGYMTFDGLLAAAVFAQTQDLEQAHERLPLARTGGMYHASAALLEPLQVGRRAIVQGMRPGPELFPWLKKNAAGNVHRAFSNMPDNILSSYRAFDADQVSWSCEGDPDAIWPLLEALPMIGKKRSTEVLQWSITDGDLDGVVGYADEPLRPVPAWLWKGEHKHVLADVCWRPAYWDPRHKAPCYVC
ncbi:hypothetical protein NYO99_15815 [Pelomonas sp. UHG3]|uniref:Uncharacterized protein n=1 Tax=Roseateles hydrophilus TaxID=2975054 RepID=A0ACC6CDS6_9BURK|nr:hypothetical protein [Pelomonas sp. UHG3]MCY4746450.1 hypothetical protein [Pelomonas sp. UHG3]